MVRSTIKLGPMEIQFTTRVFKDGRSFVAHALELDVSSCGGTKERAVRNLKTAVRLFLEEADRMGTLDQILREAGYRQASGRVRRALISVQQVNLPLTRAKA